MKSIIKGILTDVKWVQTQQKGFYSLTIQERFIKKDGQIQIIEKKNLNVWDDFLINKVRNLQIGSVLEVEGFLQTDTFQGNDGKVRVSEKLNINNIEHIALAVIPIQTRIQQQPIQQQYAQVNTIQQEQINQMYQQGNSPIINQNQGQAQGQNSTLNINNL